MAKEIISLEKGLVQDIKNELQPEGTYRFQLNGLFENIDGERGGVTNERGNEVIINIPSNPAYPISNIHLNGHCLLPNQDVLLFLTANDLHQTVQIIALHKHNQTYVELIRTNCLDWEECDQIDCIFKVHNGCDIVVYFTDHRSRYKSINITAVENGTDRYKDLTYANFLAPGPGIDTTDPNIPDVDPAGGIGNYGWLCNAFYLSPVSEHPNLFLLDVTSGGNLRVGTYTFFIRLMDLDLNPTNWLINTNPITVKKGPFNFNSPPDNTDGYYIDLTIDNFEAKTITLILDNLDLDFKYYEIGIMERSLNTGLPSYSYRTGPRLIPASGNDIFVFNDVFDSRYIDIPFSNLITKNRQINVVQTHTQIANRLVLGNLQGQVTDWSKFQQIANNIKVEYFTYNRVTINETGCDEKKHNVVSGPKALFSSDWEGVNYSSPEFLSYGMSLMRDEVYALGIIYVFNDGSESPVFHIPGRPKFGTGETTTYEIDGFDYAVYARQWIVTPSKIFTGLDILAGGLLTNGIAQFDNQALTMGVPHTYQGSWESDDLTNLPQDNNPANIFNDSYKYNYGWLDAVTCCYQIPFNSSNCNTEMERWNYYNTSLRRMTGFGGLNVDYINAGLQFDNPYYTFDDGFRGIPGYYDTGVPYPDVKDCDGVRIFPEGNVRHHRMPDHRIEQLFDIHGQPTYPEILNWGASDYYLWVTDWGNGPLVAETDYGGAFDAQDTGQYNWSMNDSESVYKLYPLGLILHDVAPPEEFRDQISGYYIVRSDRANNKTVIDKGFMNVCDTSVSTREWAPAVANNYEVVDDFGSLNGSLNKVFGNDTTLSATFKPGSGTGIGGVKHNELWWNILEFHSPKSMYNEPVLLSADYIKLESTVFGDLFFDSTGQINPGPDTSSYFESYNEGGWNGGFSCVMNRHKYPRVQSPKSRTTWAFVYNIPLSGMEYVFFNNTVFTNSLGGDSGTELYNREYKQRTLLMRYEQKCTSVAPSNPLLPTDGVLNWHVPLYPVVTDSDYNSLCNMSVPFHYAQLKYDIAHRSATEPYYLVSGSLPTLQDFILRSNNSVNYPSYESWSHLNNVITPYKWSLAHSPYMYYAALKSSVSPYRDFDSIKYIKMHSYLIPSSQVVDAVEKFPITGGDTFINRFQFEKTWYFPGGVDPNNVYADATNNRNKFVTSLTVGYVESEINSAFRHLLEGDLFRTFPFDPRNGMYEYLKNAGPLTSTEESFIEYMDKQEIFYRYKLDYSSTNTEVINIGLSTTYDYCSSCSDSFPNTLIYSEISLDSQVQDYYKLFLINSVKDIPSSTGSIQNMFVKNSDLYIHTEHNLWRISVAPQTMQTNVDTVEVGQGGFLERDPIRIFNNDDAFSRGGIVDKFSSSFVDGTYIWLDRFGGTVWALGEGPEPISSKGLSRWFSNHTTLELDKQFRALTGLPYPYIGTSCDKNTGYIAVYDPEHNRYILTKRDYKLTDVVTSGIAELTYDVTETLFDPAIVIGNFYYDDDGLYIGIANGDVVANRDTLLEYINLQDKTLAENHSWTISFSKSDGAWSSWHSYIPNWIYNDSNTFYSFITNPTDDINTNIWMHNYGEYQTYYGTKQDYIIDYIYKKNPYVDKTFDTIEYTSNVWLESTIDNEWIEIPFVTFDRFYVYNNTQLSNLKDVEVSNLIAYKQIEYDVTKATAHKWRDLWRINRLRDFGIDRLALTEPKFTQDWAETTYSDYFDNGFGYIDKVINPSFIDITKSVYQIERLTDKYLGVRLFFKPEENYKINLNLISGEKRHKF